MGRRDRPRLRSVRLEIRSLDRRGDLAHLPDQRQCLRASGSRSAAWRSSRTERSSPPPINTFWKLDRSDGAILASQAQPIVGTPASANNFDGMVVAPDTQGTLLMKSQTRAVGCTTQTNNAMCVVPARLRIQSEQQLRRRRPEDPEEPRLDRGRPERHRADGRRRAQRQDLHVRKRRQEPGAGDLGSRHPQAHPGQILGAQGHPQGSDRRRLPRGHGQLGDRRQQRQPLHDNAAVHLRGQPGQPQRRPSASVPGASRSPLRRARPRARPRPRRASTRRRA